MNVKALCEQCFYVFTIKSDTDSFHCVVKAIWGLLIMRYWVTWGTKYICLKTTQQFYAKQYSLQISAPLKRKQNQTAIKSAVVFLVWRLNNKSTRYTPSLLVIQYPYAVSCGEIKLNCIDQILFENHLFKSNRSSRYFSTKMFLHQITFSLKKIPRIR